MLFTDAPFISIADLVILDPDITNVASVENISNSFIQSAIEEAAATLEANFQNFDYNYIAGFQTNIGMFSSLVPFGDNTPRPRIRLGQVVVDSATTTYTSPLKKWVSYLAIRNFYQMASNRFVGAVGTTDRYAQKMEQLQKDIDSKYWAALKAAGLPIVNSPVPCPGASGEIGTGTWSSSNISEAAGGSDPGTSYDVAISYVTNQNVESAPTMRLNFVTDPNNVISVDISTLVPNPIPAQANTFPVVSWNLYVGVESGPLFRQATLPINTTSFTLPDAPVLSGVAAGTGQVRDMNLTFINAFFRG